MVKKYLSNEVTDIIHKHFKDEGYPVQQHEDKFGEAIKILKENKENPDKDKLKQAKVLITQSVLSAHTADSPQRPEWKEASKKAGTIIEQLSDLKPTQLKLRKII